MAEAIRRRRRVKIVATSAPPPRARRWLEEAVPRRRRRLPPELQPRHPRGPRRAHRHHPRAGEEGRPPDRHPGRPAGAEAPRRPLRRRRRGQLQPGRPSASTCSRRPATSAGAAAASRDHRRGAASARSCCSTTASCGCASTRATPDYLETEVVVGGPLSDRKGVNVPDVALPIPALTEKDRADLAFALEHGVDYDRPVLRPAPGGRGRGARDRRRPRLHHGQDGEAAAVENLDEILALYRRRHGGARRPRRGTAARGRAAGPEARWSAPRARHGKPVVVATQMLESMIERAGADPGRGLRRGDRGVRRRRCGDALGRDRRRQVSVRSGAA